MYFRCLLITCLMIGLVVPVWAGLGQEDLDETVITSETEAPAPQDEETTPDVLESVTTYPTTEVSTDITSTETSQTEIEKLETSENTDSQLMKDVILVLDNSGSMKKNDPQFLTKQAVTEFINKLDESTRAAIIIFDQDVRMAVPLTDITSASRQGLLDSLSKINYRGLYTNSPAAIESAIYDLKNNGREEARKIIVFMTDGIVDTGNADRDLEKTKWLKEDLAADAA
ncbi:MAG: VWA domain-containing protein, partial [Gammaproteobacteria bacterium]